MSKRIVIRGLLVAATVVAHASELPSQRPDSASATRSDAPVPEVVESPGSPRAALRQFLEAAREGRFERAAAFLEPVARSDRAAESLARQLKIVLDHSIWFELSDISPLASGDTSDLLAVDVDQIATIRGPSGVAEPVRLRRVAAADDLSVYWRFTAATVERVPLWFDALPAHWLLEKLPAPLLRVGLLELMWWQWLALVALSPLAFGIGWVASRIIIRVVRRAASRTTTEVDDAIVARLASPLTAAATVAALGALLPIVGLFGPAEQLSGRLLRAALVVVFLWALWRAIDVGRRALENSSWARSVPASRSLLPLGARTAKAVVLAFGFVVALTLLGYPVTSLVAGLGLGGLALALAAQKTVENVFGAFSIGIDQPFREGDFVKIEEFVGTVEAIGLRSTRFRTLDRTLITIPNGRLADMRLESFTARDRLRLAMVVGLVYETTSSQMRSVIGGFEQVLRAHPKIWPDAVIVRFAAFAVSSLDIEVMAWFQTADWGEFQRIREDILLQFMEVVERSGSRLALPTRTVHVIGRPSTPLSDPVGTGSAPRVTSHR